MAVLGGGIAGAAACMRLAQAGLEPLWIGKKEIRNFKPGEHLSTAAIPLIKTLGAEVLLSTAEHRPAHATYSAWASAFMDERNDTLQLGGPPTVLNRIAFENGLSGIALRRGVRRVWHDISNARVHENVWHLTVAENTVKAQFVFDATGRRAVIASRASTRFQADKLACIYSIWRMPPQSNAPRPVTLIEADCEGWWYLTILTDNTLLVSYFSDPDLFARSLSKDAELFQARARALPCIGAYLEDHNFQIVAPPKIASANTTWLAPAIGPGWAAIGDAAAAFDPLSSHGMTTALWSAIQAADAFISGEIKKMQAYAAEMQNGVQSFLIDRQKTYAQVARFADMPFWKRRARAPSAQHQPQDAQPSTGPG